MKITKTPRRLAPAAPEVTTLLARISAAADDELPAILDSISEWCWPRGDLYYWTQILNRFDDILQDTCRDYELAKLQTNDFTPLRKKLLVSILRFSRLLIENCTNRKLYNSYEHLNDLLLARDLDVLEETLRLVLRPAQQHSSQSSRHEFPISKERLTTLALTWTPRDHGLSLADVANASVQPPSELFNVRFQFFKRSGQAGAAVVPTHNDDGGENSGAGPSSNAAFNTPTRPRARPPAVTSLSAAGGLMATPSPHRGSGGAAADNTFRNDASSSTNHAAPHQRREGLTSVDLGNVLQQGRDAIDILTDAVEAHGIPPEERFEVLQKIRLAMSMADPVARRQILVCRMLAIACYAHVVNEATANTQLFLYEPDLVPRIATLVDPAQGCEMAIQASAFYALDSLARFRGKATEVMNSVNASVNHGIILSVLRNLVEDLATDAPQSTGHYADALFSFVALIASTGAGSHMIVSAGLVPILVDLIKVRNPNTYMVQRTVSRALGLLDSVVYSVPHAFDLFVAARGLDALVDRIAQEIERDVEDASEHRMDDSVFGEPGPDNLYGRLAFGRASMLRNMFKSISQMMTSTGTGEGLRNLIDGSLPASLKKIIDHRTIFGPQILALAINIMATFVHNEPTSLAAIQECKLPESFYSAIEDDIEANYDVIGSIPHAVGALCLNQAGLDLFNSRSVIPKLFGLFTSERHSRVFQDRDNASMFGSSIDELMRHQPSLKDSVMEAIMKCLDQIEASAESFVVPDEPARRSQYGLLVVPPSPTPPSQQGAEGGTGAAIDTDADADTGAGAGAASSAASERHIGRSVALADVITEEATPWRKDEESVEKNPVVVSIDVTARFLEGLFQTTSHCKDFLKLDGLAKMLRFYSLPSLPYDFAASMAADSLVTLFRYVTEISPSTVLTALFRDVKQSLEVAGPIWGAFHQGGDASSEPRLLSLARPGSDAEAEAANATFRQLVSLSSRTHLLSDICQTFAYAGQKMPTTYLQTLLASEFSGTVSIAELGRLHRGCAWENMLLKAALPAPPKPSSDKDQAKDKGGDGVAPSSSSSSLADAGRSASAAAATPQPGVPADLLQDVAGTVEQPAADAASTTTAAAAETGADARNAAALRYVSSQTLSSLTSFFQETIRLLAPRRNVDAAHKKAAFQAAGEIARVLQQHLQWRPSDNLTNSFAFATMMICQANCFLFDDRTNPGTVLTAVLRPFDKAGGLDALLGLYRRYTDEIDLHYNAKGEEKPASDIEAGLKLGHTCGGLKVLLGLFHRLVTAKGLTESAQTNQLIKEGGLDQFEPHAYLVRLRLAVLPAIRATWDKPWLPSLPASVNRLVLQNILTILRAQSEAVPAIKKPLTAGGLGAGVGPGALAAGGGLAVPLASLVNLRRTPPQPDEDRIRSITEMGFNRNAARHALIRCGNNLSAATEYLLLHPEIVSQLGASSATPSSTQPQDASGSSSAQAAAGAAASAAQPSSLAAPASQAAADDGDTPMKDADADAEAEAERKEHEKAKASLDQQRSEVKSTLVRRALELADVHDSLVFEVRNAFSVATTEADQINVALVDLHSVLSQPTDNAFETGEKGIALRLQLLALLLHDDDVLKNVASATKRDFVELLVELAMLYISKPAAAATATATTATTPTPAPADGDRPVPRDLEGGSSAASSKWLAPLMLVATSLLGADEETVAISDDISEPSEPESVESDVKHSLPPAQAPFALAEEAATLFDFLCTVLERASDLTREDLLAAYRLLMVLTRRRSISSSFVRRGGIQLLLRPFHTIRPRDVSGCQVLAMMTLRHVVEDLGTLSLAVEHELKSLFAQTKGQRIDTTSLLRQLDYAALRDPDVFMQVAAAKLEMVDHTPTKKLGYVRLVEDAKPAMDSSSSSPSDLAANGQASLASLRLGDDPMDAGPASPTKEAGPSTEAAKAEDAAAPGSKQQADPAARAPPPTNAPSEELDMLMQHLLSELLRYGREGLVTAKKATAASPNQPATAQGTNATATALATANSSSDAEATGAPTTAADASADSSPQEPKEPVETDEQKRADSTYFYTCFLMQCLTEMLSSYSSCKSSFVNFSRKRLFASSGGGITVPATPGAKDTATTAAGASASAAAAALPFRSKANVLGFFLTEMVPAGFLQSYESGELRKRMAQSNWAMSVIVALTADVTIHADLRDVPAELVNVRRIVLDAIAKAIKDASASSEPIEVRYGRLFALSELCHRLLIARPNITSGKQTEDLTLHMAKTMLEKNFVTVLTGALADVDLNLPTVKSLLDTILRPLEHLTKVAIKMGKAKDREGKAAVSDDSDADTFASSDYSMDEDEDDDDDDDDDDQDAPGREETPDFYRNSSLGMHTGEMETGYDDDDMSDDDDDDMEDDEDIDMEEFDSESGSETSSESDEEDDDPRVVEMMDDDDDDSDMSDGTGSDIEGMDMPEDGDEEGWTDEDEEDDEALGEMDGALDFVFDDGEGDLPEVAEAFEDEIDGGGMIGDAEMGGDEIIDIDDDEDDEDALDGHSIEDYGDGGLRELELAEDYAAYPQADDRFGANWNWTAIPADPRSGRGAGGGGGSGLRSHPALPPNFFLPTAMDNFAQASGRRPRVMDLEASLLGPRRMAPPSDDVASHPLLVEQASGGEGRSGAGGRGSRPSLGAGGGPFGPNQPAYAEWAQSIEDLVGDGAVQFLETLLGRSHQNSDIRIELTTDGQSNTRMRIDGLDIGRGMPGGHHHPPHLHGAHRSGAAASGSAANRSGRRAAEAQRNDPVAAVQAFTPQPTSTRWSEEMRIVHSTTAVASEKAGRLRAHLIRALMPGLARKREADRKQRAETEAELKKAQEAKEKIQKELEATRNRLREEEERARQEQAQAEAEASAAARAEEERQREHEQQQQQQQQAAEAAPAATPAEGADVEMADADADAAPAASGEADAAPAPAQQRVTTRINGEEIDITDTGIDPTFLEALPDDMREEVLNQHFRERRAAEATSNLAQPSNIAPEFLDALPPEIRAEVIQQEALESSRRRMRERAEQEREREGDPGNRDQGAVGQARGPVDIDPADFLASLNPDLRNQVLLEQDDSFLGSLPANILAEVENLRRQHRHFDDNGDDVPPPGRARRPAGAVGDGARREGAAAEGGHGVAGKPPAVARDAIQLLDKPGLATLVRLLFFPQMNGKQTGLYKVLANLSENSKTRAELLNLLLMVLSDGTADANAVDKTFVSMSHRASKIHATPARPTPKRFNSGPASVQHQQQQASAPATPAASVAPLSRTGDEAPFLIASRSIETLLHLTSTNQQAALYFLRDDSRAAGRKGKGKEKERGLDRSATAPINALLHLLSKQTILSNAHLVDSLLALLNTVTKPLTSMPKKASASDADADGGDAQAQADEGAAAPSTNLSANAPATATASASGPSGGEQGQSGANAGPAAGEAASGSATASAPSAAAAAPASTPAGAAAGEGSSAATAATVPSGGEAALDGKGQQDGALTTPPSIPADRLAAVVKPLATAVSSKGFQHTLAVASHLSTIEGARDVISDALRQQADAASRSLVVDLDKLIETLPEPTPEDDDGEAAANAAAADGGNGQQGQDQGQGAGGDAAMTSISGPTAMDVELAAGGNGGGTKIRSSALTSLASPASAQAILLRCLRALDYIMTGR
ncbi:related to E3 ubiquitin protein ligase TOM1 [Pseudozyma flocculosa]|uniref:Related to E3 ubiquitin protein ligase TOM1 n=1 Tax=Pseudozyma flocculosa TaxID=84751 RepID=A0A5C3F6Q4_9BASI|nr:related to E3 ubiquitin protein ligase TOM1 [Pseudozyma flocculosa]